MIDHFSTSFNWAQKNFAALWLRGWWYLLTDSAVTDVQNGGLTMVSGGGYTRSDVAQGFWNLSDHNLDVGNTQPILSDGFPEHAAASHAGPVNPKALECPPNTFFTVALQLKNDVAFQIEAFANSGRNLLTSTMVQAWRTLMLLLTSISSTLIGTLGECKPGSTNNPAGSCARTCIG